MTAPVWHEGPLAGLCWDGLAPVAWRVPHGDGDRPAQRNARRRLACGMIAHMSGQGVEDVRLARSPHGAPLVLSPAGWHLGLASRGDHSLIGVARRPVAVDCELLDDAPPLWDMLTPAEAEVVRRLPVERQPHAWMRLWTIKEAHAKLVGEPRRIAPETIETEVLDATRTVARFEGRSVCWTRESDGAVETLALWDEPIAG